MFPVSYVPRSVLANAKLPNSQYSPIPVFHKFSFLLIPCVSNTLYF